jgi:hypothetical protein
MWEFGIFGREARIGGYGRNKNAKRTGQSA